MGLARVNLRLHQCALGPLQELCCTLRWMRPGGRQDGGTAAGDWSRLLMSAPERGAALYENSLL